MSKDMQLVGTAYLIGGTSFTTAVFDGKAVPVGTKLYMAPPPTLPLVVQMMNKRKAKQEALIAEGKCPTCEGEGEIGGQFTGGYQSCPDCEGTGRYKEKQK